MTDSPGPKFTCLTLGWDLINVVIIGTQAFVTCITDRKCSINFRNELYTHLWLISVVSSCQAPVLITRCPSPRPGAVSAPCSQRPNLLQLCLQNIQHRNESSQDNRSNSNSIVIATTNGGFSNHAKILIETMRAAFFVTFYIPYNCDGRLSKGMSLSIKMLLKKSFINKEVS